jgi:S1-C subfamily serine protease
LNRPLIEEAFMPTFSSALRGSVFLLLLISSHVACTTSRIPRPASRLGPGVYQGTGFLVRPDGLVLTAYHLVEDGKTIKVRCQGYDLVPAKLGEHSRALDLAVLHTGLTGTPYLPTADPRSVRPGDHVFSMGFPSASYLGTEPKYASGAISSLTGRGREATLMLISVPTQPGGSGSPLLTMDGAVVGVVTAGTSEEEFMRDSGALPQNLNWAVKMEYATPLYDPPSVPVARPAVQKPREVAEQATRAVCIVLAAP